MRGDRAGTKSSSQGGSALVHGSDTSPVFGGNLKWFWDRIIRGGSSGHPMGDPVRYRWHRDSDTYILKPRAEDPSMRLFRRGGQWRISFDAPGLNGTTYLFSNEALDEPIYTPVALVYAVKVAANPSLRSAAMRRILSENP